MDLAFQILLTPIDAFPSVVLTKFLVRKGRAFAENRRVFVDLQKKLEEKTAKIKNKRNYSAMHCRSG